MSTRKLIAISPEQYALLMDKATDPLLAKSNKTPVERKLTELDKEISKILNDPNLSAWERIQQYKNAMQQHLEFSKQEKANLPQVVITPSVKNTQRTMVPQKPKDPDRAKKTTGIHLNKDNYQQIRKNWIHM